MAARRGVWYPEGPPALRVPVGNAISVSICDELSSALTVHGLGAAPLLVNGSSHPATLALERGLCALSVV